MQSFILPRLPKPKDRIPKKRTHIITDDARVLGFTAIEARTALYARDPLSEANDAPIEIAGRNTEGIGTDRAAISTIARYQTVWNGLLDYSIMMEDYDSGIILHRTSCPRRPLPISEDTAISYMKYRVLEAGSEVKHHTSNRPVLKPDKTPLLSLGDWKSAGSLGIYRSALSKLHSAYDTTKGEYNQACLECRKIPLARVCKSEGCKNHPGSPQYWSSGSVTKASNFQTQIDLLQEYAESNYEARSTVAFLPGELRAIRTYLLAANTLESLQLWCIIIIGVRLFLRIDEVLTLRMDAFKPEYFVVKGKEVISLLLLIQGKRDKRPVNFNLWDDHICPDLSPGHALLLLLATFPNFG
jgi:hypothetical protein